MTPVCDMNCFVCPYEDCIFDDLTYEDYQAEREIDLLSGAKVLKTSPSMRASRKQYYEENKEKIAAYGKQYREENKEAIRTEQRRYYQKNKAKWKVYAQNRKEKKANGGVKS